MKPKQIRLFVKTYCPWCNEAIDWLDQNRISYELLDVNTDADARREMVSLSDQSKAPVLEVDGKILADFGAAELAAWWEQQGYEAV